MTALSHYRGPNRSLFGSRRPAWSLLDMDRFFDEWNDGLFGGRSLARRGEDSQSFVPPVEARETESEYRVVAELPGVDAADCEVFVEDDVLILKGERKWARETEGEEGAKASGSRSFHRRFRFASDIAADAVEASYKNGILTVTLPKLVEARPEPRSIPVQAG